MKVLQELESFINEFNLNNDEDFNIDSIRVDFSKQHKRVKLYELGEWKKVNQNDQIIMKRLKKRLTPKEITTAFQLEDYNIYYYNKVEADKTNNKYRKATMIIFGLKQYLKSPPPKHIVTKIVSILKDITNIDLCLDIPYKPNLEALSKKFTLKQYFDKKIKAYTNTYYINDTRILMMDKIVIYNKGEKNNLPFIVWRLEALIQIPNIKLLALPLQELKQIADIAKG